MVHADDDVLRGGSGTVKGNQTRSIVSESKRRTSMEHLMLWKLMNQLPPSSPSLYLIPQVNQRLWLKAQLLSMSNGIDHTLMEEARSKDIRLSTERHQNPHGWQAMDLLSSLRLTQSLDW